MSVVPLVWGVVSALVVNTVAVEDFAVVIDIEVVIGYA